MKIKWSDEAERDLWSIWEYIARDSFYFADAFRNELKSTADLLATSPEMGRVIPEKGDDKEREIVHKSYRIMYRIEGEVIVITTVFHGARLFKP